LCISFDKKWVGPKLGPFINKLIGSPCSQPLDRNGTLLFSTKISTKYRQNIDKNIDIFTYFHKNIDENINKNIDEVCAQFTSIRTRFSAAAGFEPSAL
jgi:hypothetical protein